eukprot:XP_001697276.1 predicted protein [Chlamydomonas reinhardtii]
MENRPQAKSGGLDLLEELAARFGRASHCAPTDSALTLNRPKHPPLLDNTVGTSPASHVVTRSHANAQVHRAPSSSNINSEQRSQQQQRARPYPRPLTRADACRLAAYVGQADAHLPELTAGETLAFAASCKPRLLCNNNPTAQAVAELLGLSGVLHTRVGDEMRAGLSGGERRRLTLGEAALSLAPVLMLDEITSGLDAAVALSVVRTLRRVCDLANPSPEVVALFDNVLLLAAGRVAFLGPRDRLAPFLARVPQTPGLAPWPPGQPLAEFVQEVLASPADQAKYQAWRPARLPAAGAVAATAAGRAAALTDGGAAAEMEVEAATAAGAAPRGEGAMKAEAGAWVSPAEVREAFEHSEEGRALAAQLAAAPYNHPLEFVFQGFVVATAFLRLPPASPASASLAVSALAFSLMGMFMLGFNSAPVYVSRLPVFYKQRDAHMLSALVYFAVGLTPQPGRFFVFLGACWLSGLSSVATFQLLGAVTRRQGLGAVLLMVNVLCSGFPIARTSIAGWWIWFYWISPMAWILRSMAVSEMSSARWLAAAPAVPAGSAVPAAVTGSGTGSGGAGGTVPLNIGLATLAARGFPTAPAWVWWGLAYLAATTALQLLAQAAALGCLGPPGAAAYDYFENPLEATVEEALLFSAQLRARKRLTLAVELVANPSVIFMDEPTTGLDARAAGVVMRAVRSAAATGRTVVCTIHQPSREIMDGFDELLLLKPGGRTAYWGPLGPSQCKLVEHFMSPAAGVAGVAGVARPAPDANPADWVLGLTSPGAEAALGVDWARLWATSEARRWVMAVVEAERVVFYRERAAHMYSTAVFAAAQGLAELPPLLLQSLLYTVPLYAAVHLAFTAAKAAWFWLFVFLGLTSIRPWWLWAYWANPVTYVIYGATVTQLGDMRHTPLRLALGGAAGAAGAGGVGGGGGAAAAAAAEAGSHQLLQPPMMSVAEYVETAFGYHTPLMYAWCAPSWTRNVC